MRGPSPRLLLETWEAGAAADHTGRALLLAGLADDPPTGDVADLAIGARDRLLIDLRERLFGQDVDAMATCPGCGERLEFSFELADVRFDSAEPPAGPVTEEIGRYVVTGRLPTSRDLMLAARCATVDAARAMLLDRCVLAVEVDGAPVAREQVPDDVLAAFGAALEEADPQAHVEVALRCVACGTTWAQVFDIVEYLWIETERWAHGLLREVHALARAYGWSEEAILALEPARRRRYLEMVQDA